jgi:hypothetical protein
VEELKMRLVRDTIFKVFLTMHGFEQMTREEFVALQRKARRHKLVSKILCGCALCMESASRMKLR